MVQDAGKEDGVGIWEITDYKQLEDRIINHIAAADEQFTVTTIYITGSYGSGMGVLGESDLDVVIEGEFPCDLTSAERTILQKQLASHLEQQDIVSDYPDITGLDPFIETSDTVTESLQYYAVHEPVTHYYNLTENTKEEY